MKPAILLCMLLSVALITLLTGCGLNASLGAIDVEKAFGRNSSCFLLYRELVMGRNIEYFWQSQDAMLNCGTLLSEYHRETLNVINKE